MSRQHTAEHHCCWEIGNNALDSVAKLKMCLLTEFGVFLTVHSGQLYEVWSVYNHKCIY